MANLEKEVISLLEAQMLRAIDIENNRREINEIRCRLRKENQNDDEDIGEDLVETPDSPARERTLKRTKSTVARVLGMESYSAISNLNTKTLSMYAVVKTVDRNSTKIWRLAVALKSLLFVCIQLSVMTYVLTETSWPSCHSMSDCPFGTYCEEQRKTPTCADCADFYNQTQYFEDFCPTLLGSENWDLMDQIEDLDHSELWVKPGTDSNFIKCYGFKHCMNNDIDAKTNFRGHCDFIALNKNKTVGWTWLSLIFFGFLWALPICKDIEEAALEEIVLDHLIADSFSFAAEIVRINLRIRRCLLPLVTTATTIALIVTDDVSPKNIVLNFMTITFITEADNIIAILFLRTRHKELMEETTKHINTETLPNLKATIFWCRMQGFSCVFVLMIGIGLTDIVVDNCESFEEFFWTILVQSFFVLAAIQSIYRIFVKKGDEKILVRIISAVFEFSRNYIACAFVMYFRHSIDYCLFSDAKLLVSYGNDSYVRFIIFFNTYFWLYAFKRRYYKKN